MKRRELDIAKVIAPEDIREGMYVALFSETVEHWPCGDDGAATSKPARPARMDWLPDDGAAPVRVAAVCLPFVLVRRTDGKLGTLDVRRYRLARVSKRFGRRAFERPRRKP